MQAGSGDSGCPPRAKLLPSPFPRAAPLQAPSPDSLTLGLASTWPASMFSSDVLPLPLGPLGGEGGRGAENGDPTAAGPGLDNQALGSPKLIRPPATTAAAHMMASRRPGAAEPRTPCSTVFLAPPFRAISYPRLDHSSVTGGTLVES
jgi:hypothetical protein